jgi:hypothetical protein
MAWCLINELSTGTTTHSFYLRVPCPGHESTLRYHNYFSVPKMFTHFYAKYRVIQEELPPLTELISDDILSNVI